MRAAPGDLTASAAIREAAMRLFAERGAAGVTIREVASEAGVSPSLVIHHYRSKQGLKQAVDQRAAALVEGVMSEMTDPSRGGSTATSLAAVFSDQLEREPLLPAYVRRLLIDGGEPADTLFRALFDATLLGLASLETAGLARPAIDADIRAAFLLINDLALVLLREQVGAILGFDPLTRSGMQRWTAQALDIYAQGIFNLGGSAASSATSSGESS